MTKTLAYLWVLPNTLLGCLLGLWYRGTFRWVEGAIEVSNVPGLFRRIGQLTGVVGEGHGAMCLGHCILAPNDAAMAGCRRHERIHVRQYAFWGPFYLPLYFLWSWYLMCHGRDSYFDNPFEQEAYRLQHRGPDDASSVPTGQALRRAVHLRGSGEPELGAAAPRSGTVPVPRVRGAGGRGLSRQLPGGQGRRVGDRPGHRGLGKRQSTSRSRGHELGKGSKAQ
jgi:hypothetical protein